MWPTTKVRKYLRFNALMQLVTAIVACFGLAACVLLLGMFIGGGDPGLLLALGICVVSSLLVTAVSWSRAQTYRIEMRTGEEEVIRVMPDNTRGPSKDDKVLDYGPSGGGISIILVYWLLRIVTQWMFGAAWMVLLHLYRAFRLLTWNSADAVALFELVLPNERPVALVEVRDHFLGQPVKPVLKSALALHGMQIIELGGQPRLMMSESVKREFVEAMQR